MMFMLSLTLHTGNEHTVAALSPTVAAKQLNVVLEQQLQHRVYGMTTGALSAHVAEQLSVSTGPFTRFASEVLWSQPSKAVCQSVS